jgi:DNA-binding transcriptional LysR family regulator
VAGATRLANAKVHVLANESVTSYVLPGILPQLRKRWPNTRFTVSVATCHGVRDGVASGAYDVGLLLEESSAIVAVNDEAAVSTPFAERRVIASSVRLILFASVSHPLLLGGTSAVVRPVTLSEYPLFVSDAAGDFHDLILRFFKNERDDGPVIEATGSIEGVKKAVIDDTRAIGLLPAYALVEELRASAVARLNLRPAPPPMRLDALLSQSRARHPSVEELLAEVGSTVTRVSR